MALIGDYTELLLDKEKWINTYNDGDSRMLAALGWLIIDLLLKHKQRPSVVIKFRDLSEVEK